MMVATANCTIQLSVDNCVQIAHIPLKISPLLARRLIALQMLLILSEVTMIVAHLPAHAARAKVIAILTPIAMPDSCVAQTIAHGETETTVVRRRLHQLRPRYALAMSIEMVPRVKTLPFAPAKNLATHSAIHRTLVMDSVRATCPAAQTRLRQHLGHVQTPTMAPQILMETHVQNMRATRNGVGVMTAVASFRESCAVFVAEGRRLPLCPLLV